MLPWWRRAALISMCPQGVALTSATGRAAAQGERGVPATLRLAARCSTRACAPHSGASRPASSSTSSRSCRTSNASCNKRRQAAAVGSAQVGCLRAVDGDCKPAHSPASATRPTWLGTPHPRLLLKPPCGCVCSEHDDRQGPSKGGRRAGRPYLMTSGQQDLALLSNVAAMALPNTRQEREVTAATQHAGGSGPDRRSHLRISLYARKVIRRQR
jgi:hypothetical protein